LKKNIHSTAIIEGEVNFGQGCFVEAFALIRGKVQSGQGCYFGAGCVIQGHASIGNHVFLGEKTTIGFPSQEMIQTFQKGEDWTPVISSKATRIGDNCVVRSGSVIYVGSQVGNNVRMGHNVLIREQVKIGDNTTVGTGVIIDGQSSIGSKVSIQSNAYIPWNTLIEDHVFLGPNCILTNDKYVMRAPYELKGPIIREGASVGAGAIVLPNIEIGAEAVIGAGTVVTKDVPAKAIIYGIPARIQGSVPDTWKKPLE
jgi:acetyltransferase-like isoleucine patch superfamily enzyme